jgi:hypothetical protein
LHFFRPLELLQTRVQTVLCEQLIVRATLDDAACSSTRMTFTFLIVAIRCQITDVVLPEMRRSPCQVRHRRAKREEESAIDKSLARSGAKRGKAPRQRWLPGIAGNMVCVTYRI